VIDLSVQSVLQKEKIEAIGRSFSGSDELENWKVAATRGSVRDILAQYQAEVLYGEKRGEVEQLVENKITNRLGEYFTVNAVYIRGVFLLQNLKIAIEEKMQAFLEEEYKAGNKERSTADVTKMIGRQMSENSFLYWAYKNEIPVIVPGIMDGAVGSQIWLFTQKHHDFKLNLIADADLLSGLIFKAKKSGALMIGGGVPKHHTLWWNQYRDGLDYAVYITTAQEFDGSSSGALVDEAISWGKVTQNAKQTTVHAEATTILPFLYSALLSRLEK
jgi:deoxyhypusine synthase